MAPLVWWTWVASPGPGGRQVAILRLHVTSTGHRMNAAYSCASKSYVRQSTKEEPNFGESRKAEVRRTLTLRSSVHRCLPGEVRQEVCQHRPDGRPDDSTHDRRRKWVPEETWVLLVAHDDLPRWFTTWMEGKEGEVGHGRGPRWRREGHGRGPRGLERRTLRRHQGEECQYAVAAQGDKPSRL
jgi:hypothetical protein